MSGLIHIYTGDGVGKTTASFGLGMRAAGHGLRVAAFQFFKNTPTGEVASAESLPRFSVYRADTRVTGFLWELTPDDADALRRANRALFDRARRDAADFDLMILDEIFVATSCGAVPEDVLLSFLRGKPETLELVLTGRDAPRDALDAADYVTEMRYVRHPMERGVAARRGVEF